MAQNTKRSINELLVSLFNHVMDMEAKAVITEEYRDITNNDMHIIEAIGIEEPRNMSVIARRLSVTVSTLTTNMNGLERKGYIKRERSQQDKRVVYVLLTEKGRKAFYHHRDFHKKNDQGHSQGLRGGRDGGSVPLPCKSECFSGGRNRGRLKYGIAVREVEWMSDNR